MVVRERSSKHKITTFWHLCVQWKVRTTTWERLSYLKESHLIQVVEYLLAQGIIHEPVFNCWVTYVLKKREAIISDLMGTASRVINKNIKFGIRLPKTVVEALRLEKKIMGISCGYMVLQKISIQL